MAVRHLCYSRSMIYDVLRAIVTRSPPHPVFTRAPLHCTSLSRSFIHIKVSPNASAVSLEQFDQSLGPIPSASSSYNNNNHDNIPTITPSDHSCSTTTSASSSSASSTNNASTTNDSSSTTTTTKQPDASTATPARSSSRSSIRICRHYKKPKPKPGSVQEYNRRIYYAIAQMQLNKGLKIFRAMERQGLKPDVASYTMVINGFCNVSDMERAQRWFHRMRANGIEPDVCTYTSLIDGYMRMSDLVRAETVFRNMMLKGIRPTRTTYNILMHHSVMQLDIETAVRFWGKLVNAGLRPDVYTYAIMIHGLGDEGQIDKAWRLYETMVEQNVNVNEVVATSLMGMHVRSHDNSYAIKVFRNFFKDNALSPTAHTRNTLLNALIANADLATIQDYYSKYLAHLDQLQHTSRNRRSRSDKDEHEGLFPGANVFTYTSFMRAFLRRDALPMVSQVYQDMMARGLKPTLVTYSILMLAHAYIPDPYSCRKILDELKTAGLKPNAILYTILLRAWAKSGRWDEMKKIYREMKDANIQPTKLTLSVLQWGRKQAR